MAVVQSLVQCLLKCNRLASALRPSAVSSDSGIRATVAVAIHEAGGSLRDTVGTPGFVLLPQRHASMAIGWVRLRGFKVRLEN